MHQLVILCSQLQLREESMSYYTHLSVAKGTIQRLADERDSSNVIFLLLDCLRSPHLTLPCAVPVLELPERPAEGRENPEEACKVDWRQSHKEQGDQERRKKGRQEWMLLMLVFLPGNRNCAGPFHGRPFFIFIAHLFGKISLIH